MSRKAEPVDDWETIDDVAAPEVAQSNAPVPLLAQEYTFHSSTPIPTLSQQPAPPQMMILQRPSSAASNRSNSSSQQKQERTLQQRQQDYKEARERIFGKESPSERPKPSLEKPKVSLTRAPVQPDPNSKGFQRTPT
jgi:hypothetical protein